MSKAKWQYRIRCVRVEGDNITHIGGIMSPTVTGEIPAWSQTVSKTVEEINEGQEFYILCNDERVMIQTEDGALSHRDLLLRLPRCP